MIIHLDGATRGELGTYVLRKTGTVVASKSRVSGVELEYTRRPCHSYGIGNWSDVDHRSSDQLYAKLLKARNLAF